VAQVVLSIANECDECTTSPFLHLSAPLFVDCGTQVPRQPPPLAMQTPLPGPGGSRAAGPTDPPLPLRFARFLGISLAAS
jgi:hypothetical protein